MNTDKNVMATNRENNKRTFTDRYSPFVTYFLLIFALIYIGSYLILGFANSKKYEAPRTLTEIEQIKLTEAYDRICLVNASMCTDIREKKIDYLAIPMGRLYSILNLLHSGDYAVTFKHNENFEIRISETLFSSDIPLTVFLYHELEHVRADKSFSFDIHNNKEVMEACFNHNQVKHLTTQFSETLERYLTEKNVVFDHYDSPRYIATLEGNQIKDCNEKSM